MARKRRPVRRRTRRAPARRTTRRGMPRRTARLAYSRRPQGRVRRVRRKRNPRGLFGSPAVRYASYAVAGAAAASYLNGYASRELANAAASGASAPGLPSFLKPQFGDRRLDAGVVGAAATFAAVMFLPGLKANTKANLSAAAVGMLTVPVVNAVTQALPAPTKPEPVTTAQEIVSRLQSMPSASYNSANAYNGAWSSIPVS
jgi:hypothetical protein